MALQTSNSRLLLDAFLDARNLTGCIDAITTSCDVNKGKPEPDVYLKTAEKLAVSPQHCLVFEDIPMGILAGKRAGMTVCAVEDDYSALLRAEKIQTGRLLYHRLQAGSGSYLRRFKRI